MVVKNEALSESDVILFEEDKRFSRETVTIASGEGALAIGAVLGKIDRNIIGAVTPGGANVGNGAPSAATPGPDIQIGTYELTAIVAAVNGGTFVVKTPSGTRLAKDLTVGVAYASSHLNLTIADGAADFAVGDKFTVAVSGSGKYAASPAALIAAKAGAEKASAVLAEAIDATAADAKAVVIRRHAVVNRAKLSFAADVDTAPERQAKIDQLAALTILARTGA